MKKLILMILTALLAFSLCACSLLPLPNGPEEPVSGASSAAAAPSASESSAASKPESEKPSSAGESSSETPEISSQAPQPSESSEESRPAQSEASASDESSASNEKFTSLPSERSEPAQLEWSGVYLYGEESTGEVLIVKGVSAGAVYGTYIFEYAAGGFGAREFTWPLDPADPNRASELFQNGDDYNYFNLREDRITVDYPAGWWADRDYLYWCPVDRREQYPDHPYLTQEEESSAPQETHAPFYGIWIAASGDYDEVKAYADEMRERGFNAGVYVTTDWSNLNPVRWYVVSAGEYPSEEAAEADLFNVRDAGWTDAYIKYTGDFKG